MVMHYNFAGVSVNITSCESRENLGRSAAHEQVGNFTEGQLSSFWWIKVLPKSPKSDPDIDALPASSLICC